MDYYMIHIEKMDSEHKNEKVTAIVNQYQLKEIKKIIEESEQESNRR